VIAAVIEANTTISGIKRKFELLGKYAAIKAELDQS
jgi:hypothetical protein